MNIISASIIGASGYTGGELLRILLQHPGVNVKSVSSEQNAGQMACKVHPNLRGFTELEFVRSAQVDTNVDILFLCTPHGVSMNLVPSLLESGTRIIDLSADFRLKSPIEFEKWYGHTHSHPELLQKSVYGLPELHREEIKKADFVASPGCLATSAILALAPLVKNNLIELDKIVVDSKIGSSAGGAKPGEDSHHPARSGTVRAYKPSGHRHTGEMEQELNLLNGNSAHVRISFSPHAIELVRGIFTTTHSFSNAQVSDKDLWIAYRKFYSGSPFIRFLKEKNGVYRYPEPKLVEGTNFCDIGFEVDSHSQRIVAMSAIDNLVKGAAGQSIQSMNLMFGLDETTGLWNASLHPA